MRTFFLLIVLAWVTTGTAFGAVDNSGSPDLFGRIGNTSSADHHKLAILQGPFKNGPQVTKACLTCHTESAKHVMATKHWTWNFRNKATGQNLGKLSVLNSFCGSPHSNWTVCSDCHVGYGWKPNGIPIDAHAYDFTNESNVDCLVCHDTTGEYHKSPEDGGQVFDLAEVAMSVGRTSRKTCGKCHFFGGGGDGVKHGDMDSSLYSPNRSLDVHMHAGGLNFNCTTCHSTIGHQIAGSRYTPKAKDLHGIDVPGWTDATRTSCESCHGFTPHPKHPRLNNHARRVACQTCHIPFLARGGKKTKIWWDWSTATRLNSEGKPFSEKDADGYETYTSQKGTFRWASHIVPEYFWFNGVIQYTLPGDPMANERPLKINNISGSYGDSGSRIWPFKVMQGKQAYDPVQHKLLIVHTAGDDDSALWKHFNWDKAIRAGMASVNDTSYSGKYDFVETKMYWPAAHMVAPIADALKCTECHSRNGRLANLTGFYMPGRDRFPLMDTLGWILVAMVSIGSLSHAALRIYFNLKDRR